MDANGFVEKKEKAKPPHTIAAASLPGTGTHRPWGGSLSPAGTPPPGSRSPCSSVRLVLASGFHMPASLLAWSRLVLLPRSQCGLRLPYRKRLRHGAHKPYDKERHSSARVLFPPVYPLEAAVRAWRFARARWTPCAAAF